MGYKAYSWITQFRTEMWTGSEWAYIAVIYHRTWLWMNIHCGDLITTELVNVIWAETRVINILENATPLLIHITPLIVSDQYLCALKSPYCEWKWKGTSASSMASKILEIFWLKVLNYFILLEWFKNCYTTNLTKPNCIHHKFTCCNTSIGCQNTM